MEPATPQEFFAGHPDAYRVFTVVRDLVAEAGPAEVRVSRSQVAFRRRRGFAYLWLPGTWLREPASEVVLSIALPRHDTSARFKQVAHPSPRVWMHHLEVRDLDALDAEVAGWLAEASAAAA